tara:strand:- start:79 stop:573 length:495 start_codon:yes stop_codon:yes gene_type:complete
MNIVNNLFLFNKKNVNNKGLSNKEFDKYEEIAKLVKEARKNKNLTLQELSNLTKIPERTINSIENNNQNTRPKYPFITSILFKLEECLVLEKNTLLKLAIREKETSKIEKKEFLLKKFDLINTWQGSVFYFFILILTLFILKRYFVINVKVIEIQNIENKIMDK